MICVHRNLLDETRQHGAKEEFAPSEADTVTQLCKDYNIVFDKIRRIAREMKTIHNNEYLDENKLLRSSRTYSTKELLAILQD